MQCVHKEEGILVCRYTSQTDIQNWCRGSCLFKKTRTLVFLNVPFGIVLCYCKIVMSSAMQGCTQVCFYICLCVSFLQCASAAPTDICIMSHEN